MKRIDLFYPSAKDWMWNYCINLGKFTDTKGNNFDLGIYIRKQGYPSFAIVYGNEENEYLSGEIHPRFKDDLESGESKLEHYIETLKRAKAQGLIK